MDVGTDVVLDFVFHRQRGCAIDECLGACRHIRAVFVHRLELVGQHRDAQRLRAVADAHLLVKIAR